MRMATQLDRGPAGHACDSLFLVQALAAQHDRRPGGRALFFTPGQHLAAMADELPYIATKGAIHQLTLSSPRASCPVASRSTA